MIVKEKITYTTKEKMLSFNFGLEVCTIGIMFTSLSTNLFLAFN